MSQALAHRLLHQQALSPVDASTLLAAARALRQADLSGQTQPLLRGKNIAVLCSDTSCAGVQAITDAASRLGARVAHVRPDPALEGGDGASTARLLAKLYDAVDCESLPQALAQKLQRASGLPVFQGLACADHPLSALLPDMRAGTAGDQGAGEDDRRYLVQALLVNAVS